MAKIEVRRLVMIGDKIEISVREVEVIPSKTWDGELKEWKEKVEKEKVNKTKG